MQRLNNFATPTEDGRIKATKDQKTHAPSLMKRAAPPGSSLEWTGRKGWSRDCVALAHCILCILAFGWNNKTEIEIVINLISDLLENHVF